MGRRSSRGCNAASLALIAPVENHSQFSNYCLHPASFKWYALGSFCRNEVIMPGMGLEKYSHNKRPCQVFLISFLEAKSHETTTHIPRSDRTCLSNQCHFGQNVPKSWEYPESWIHCRNADRLAGLLILVLVRSLETVDVFLTDSIT